LFCNIAGGRTDTQFVHETDTLVVFDDINPAAPVHQLVVPKRHIRSVNDLAEEDGGLLAQMIMTGKDMAAKAGVSEAGYKLLFNVEYGGGQRIFHLHMHLLAGREWS
jgi:histidine triad (HIT) family protein